MDYPFKGYSGKLTHDQADRLEETLHSTSLPSLREGCSYVEKTFGVHYTRPGMHYVFARLKVKKKTARPTHVHKDEAGEKRFKKDFPRLKGRDHKHIYFEDEMRAGPRTECKQRWAAKGHRRVCKVKLGYAFTYLYAAIKPATGNLIVLLLPDMTKQSFSLFMDYFKKETVVLVADGAGSHQKQVCDERGIAFEKLPTACPELNPVERFFEELRKALSDQVFTALRKVENCLCRILGKYFDHPKTLVKLCHFPYIRDA